VTKSGIILGMGETTEEVQGALVDLRQRGVELITLGQYLRRRMLTCRSCAGGPG